MKTHKHIVLLIALMGAMWLMMGCRKDNLPEPQPADYELALEIDSLVPRTYAFCAGTHLRLQLTAEVDSFVWSPGGVTNEDLVTNTPGEYILTTYENGQAQGWSFPLTNFDPEMTVPRRFSPNGDAWLDTFYFVNYCAQEMHLQVFDLANEGVMIYETEDFGADWDLTYENGETIPVGTYAYLLTYVNLLGERHVVEDWFEIRY